MKKKLKKLVIDPDLYYYSKNTKNTFDSLEKQRAGLFVPSKTSLIPTPPCNLLLNVPRWYFCCGSTILHVVMSECLWPPAIKSPA